MCTQVRKQPGYSGIRREPEIGAEVSQDLQFQAVVLGYSCPAGDLRFVEDPCGLLHLFLGADDNGKIIRPVRRYGDGLPDLLSNMPILHAVFFEGENADPVSEPGILQDLFGGQDFFGKAVLVFADHLDGSRQDRGTAAVVDVQGDLPGIRIVTKEIPHKSRGGAAKTVDRLVVVSYGKQISVREDPHQLILRAADVLKFIDQQEGKLLSPPGGFFRLFFKDPQRLQDHVVIIDAVRLFQILLIFTGEVPYFFVNIGRAGDYICLAICEVAGS